MGKNGFIPTLVLISCLYGLSSTCVAAGSEDAKSGASPSYGVDTLKKEKKEKYKENNPVKEEKALKKQGQRSGKEKQPDLKKDKQVPKDTDKLRKKDRREKKKEKKKPAKKGGKAKADKRKKDKTRKKGGGADTEEDAFGEP